MKKNKIILIQVWLGKIPDYFWFHYETTKNIIDVDFLFITDQNIVLDAKNYVVVKTTKEEIELLLLNKLNNLIILKNNKKACDLKPCYGELFEGYLDGYDYYGHYDIDTLFGNFNSWLTPHLGKHDVISIADELNHNRISAPFTIVKNTFNNRRLYRVNFEDFIRSFEHDDILGFDENQLNRIFHDFLNVKLLYNSMNCESDNGSKNTYDVCWSGGNVYVNEEEKMIYHFYRKNHTVLQKVGNQIYGRYDKKYINDFYWVFGFTENYSSTVKYLMESIHNYSNRKCIIYTINFDYKLPDKFLTSEQFILRRINIEEGKKDHRGRDENIISCKPKLMIDAINQYPNKKFIFMDSDVYLTVAADDISKYFLRLTNYPLINSHTHDKIYLKGLVEGEEWTSTIDIIANKVGVDVCVFPRRKTNIMLFDKNSEWFFQEQIDLYETYKDSKPGIFAFHDEDSANLILSKYKLLDCLHLCDIEECDNVDMNKFFDTNHPFHMTGLSPFLVLPKHQNDVVFFHGLKDNSRFQSIKKIYGNTVLDCEEILVTYSDNTIFFEKNSFLNSKKINENVDFIISDLENNVVERLENQELNNYWIFYISNVFLEKKSYIIEIFGTNSKIKLYNNLITIVDKLEKVPITFVMVTRNDNYSGNPIDRLKKSLKYNLKNIQEVFPDTFDQFEFLIGDWGSDEPITYEMLELEKNKNVKIYYFPKEITTSFDTEFNEVHSLNFLIRHAKNEYVARLDQDIILGKSFLEYIKNCGLVKDKFYWSARRDLENDIPVENYSAPSWDIDTVDFYKGAIGIILLTKKSWIKVKGYNEKLIYRAHMEHDLYERFLGELGPNSCVNLGVVLNVPFFHLFHPREDLANRKANTHDDIYSFDNDENWGLENKKELIKLL